MATVDASSAELELRLRAEELVALAAFGPVAEVMAELDAFDAAASALAGSGILPPERSTALVGEVVDALVVRGASWLAPIVPALDVTRLYDTAAGGRQPLLRRVAPVLAPLGSGTITSLELWSDRAVARMIGPDGVVVPSHVVGAAGVGDRRLELRDPSGAAVAVDLTTGRVARESPGEVVRSSVGQHLEAVLTSAVAGARRDPSVHELNRLRVRIASAAEVVAPAGTADLLDRFDAAVLALDTSPTAAPFLLEVVPVAQRFFGGWLLSVELWSDHWRAVIVEEDPGSLRWWTATDDRGDTFGGAAMDAEVVRFDPALPLAWSTLRLERRHADEVLAIEVVR